jgi:hypothetical protein
MSRWVRVSADIFEHEFFARSEMSEREAWLWLITKAAWKDTRHRIGGDMVVCERGSLFFTLRGLADVWGWKSDTRVRAFLDALEKERMIERKTNAGKTQVFVTNYDTYQSTERKENAEETQEKRKENALKIPEYKDTTLLERASAPTRAELDDLEAECRKASGTENNPSPNLLDLSAITGAIRDGADLHADILPVIRQITQRGHRWRSWNYALQAISDARERRLNGLPPPSPTMPAGNRPNARPTIHDAARSLVERLAQPDPEFPAPRASGLRLLS